MLIMIIRVLNKICSFLHITIFYDNNYGIKVLNRKKHLKPKYKGDIQLIDSEKLYYGFDGLKDDYSLLDRTIKNGPHYHLMKHLEIGLVKDDDYIQYRQNGRLDGLDKQKVNVNNMHAIFCKRKKEIMEDKYDYISFYLVNGRKYILDGKHRVALCILLNKKIKAKEVDIKTMDYMYIKGLYKKMMKNKKDYNKNIEHLSKIIKEMEK